MRCRGERNPGEYKDVPGFCKSATVEEIAAHGYILTPGRYVGAEQAQDDDEPFEVKMQRLTSRLEEQFEESAKLQKAVRDSLRALSHGNKTSSGLAILHS